MSLKIKFETVFSTKYSNFDNLVTCLHNIERYKTMTVDNTMI